MKNENLLKSCVSEICVKGIRVDQGVLSDVKTKGEIFFQLFVAFSELFELQLHKKFEPSKDGLPCQAKKILV